jgi:hypothetical protein
MSKLSGKYSFVSQENFDDYLKAAGGANFFPLKLAKTNETRSVTSLYQEIKN